MTTPPDVPWSHPSEMDRCPSCGATFGAPDMRECDDLTHLDFCCPTCGYHYAHWPKSAGFFEEDQP